MKTYYAIYVGDMKWLGNMKKWQAYYLAFHLKVIMLSAKNKTTIKITKEV